MEKKNILKRPLSLLSQLVPFPVLFTRVSNPSSSLDLEFPIFSLLEESLSTIHLLLTTLRKATGDIDPASSIDDSIGGDDALGFASFAVNEDDADNERSRSHLFFHTVRVRDDRDKAGRGWRSHARKKCEVGMGARYASNACAERADGDVVDVVMESGSAIAKFLVLYTAIFCRI